MGEVIHVHFGQEREWDLYRDELVCGLIMIGRYYGDPEALMRSKGDCAVRMLRQMITELPNLNLKVDIPDDLSPQHTREITAAIKAAALIAVEHAAWHAANSFLESMNDLCTSALAGPPRTPGRSKSALDRASDTANNRTSQTPLRETQGFVSLVTDTFEASPE